MPLTDPVPPSSACAELQCVPQLSARKEAELEKKRRLVAAIKANVSDEGRDLFAHIAKTCVRRSYGADLVGMFSTKSFPY